MTDWVDVSSRRGTRRRHADVAVPARLPLLDAAQRGLLGRWVRSDGVRRTRAVLLSDAGPARIEDVEALCDLLLREGWLARHERLTGGAWIWDAISWRDLPRLQTLLGVAGPRQREAMRQADLAQAEAWLQARGEQAGASQLDPDLQDELARAIDRLKTDKSLRPEVLAGRLGLLRAVADWRDAGAQGSRRDFALQARGTTKALTEAEWRWLQEAFDLERLHIERFAPMVWLAGEVALSWAGRRVDVGAVHCMGLPLDDLCRADRAAGPARWWLIENRASFERQARAPAPGVALAWLPGRPSAAWLRAVGHLLALAPAPAWISADADPSGVDIACTAGALWDGRGLSWTPYRMEAAQLAEAGQDWPLNLHDRRLLAALLARPGLPPALRGLCKAMLEAGRKAEQEGWL